MSAPPQIAPEQALVVNVRGGAGEPAIELPARTLDELSAELGWSASDFLKLGARSGGLAALRGA